MEAVKSKSLGTAPCLSGQWGGGWNSFLPTPIHTDGRLSVRKGAAEGSNYTFLCYDDVAVFVIDPPAVKNGNWTLYDFKVIDMSDCWRTLPDEPRRAETPVLVRKSVESLTRAAAGLAALRAEAYWRSLAVSEFERKLRGAQTAYRNAHESFEAEYGRLIDQTRLRIHTQRKP